MSTFALSIATDNAAFSNGNKAFEVARLLREVADRLAIEGSAAFTNGIYRLRDYNGNRVGFATFDGPDND